MNIADIIDSLLDQIDDRVSLIPADEPDSIFAHDAEALRAAVRILRRIERAEMELGPKVQAKTVKSSSMDMTFIGKDGSMGLRYGERYSVTVFYAEGFYWLSWNTAESRVVICPYTSLKTLLDNWQTKPVTAPTQKNPYRTIAKHLYRAHRKYEGSKTLLILADDITEAISKAQRTFGTSSVHVSKVLPTDDPQVYEV